jgi:hypothetical protein
MIAKKAQSADSLKPLCLRGKVKLILPTYLALQSQINPHFCSMISTCGVFHCENLHSNSSVNKLKNPEGYRADDDADAERTVVAGFPDKYPGEEAARHQPVVGNFESDDGEGDKGEKGANGNWQGLFHGY